MKPSAPISGFEDLSSSFGFGDESWESHLSSALHVRLPDAPPGYILIEKTGEGGQGAVYKARQNTTGRFVAAKRLHGGSSTFERFERELHALSTFSHRAIVSVVAAERSPDQRWLILDWIDGIPVDAWAQSLPPAESLGAVLGLMIEICDGVQHAHSRGVIHRDLKPSNILVDTQSCPHILDFGIAKIVDEHERTTFTATGSLLGTLGYIAPEQLTARHEPLMPDIRIDVYALGAVLYKLLTGKDPLTAISGENPSAAQAFAAASDHRSPDRPSSLTSSLPRDLDVVVLKALHPDPDLRYATVDALRTDLQNVLEKRPVAAQPPTIRYLARTFVRRQRIAVSIAAIALLLILSLTIFLGALSYRLSRQSKELVDAAQESRKQQQIALDLADQRKKTAESLAAMVRTLAGTDTGESAFDAVDAKLLDAVSLVESGALSGDIDTEILLRATLRSTLFSRGMLREAVRQGERYIELLTSRYGPQSREVAAALNNHTLVCQHMGDYPAAERAARRAIEIDVALKGPDATPASAYLSNLASVLHGQGKFHEAELLYRQRLADLLTRADATTEVIARAKRNIGAELVEQNGLEEAEQFTLGAMQDLMSIPKPPASAEDSLLRVRRNLALIRVRQDRVEEAESLQRDVVTSMATLKGSRHSDLLQERVHLASILFAHKNNPAKRTEALALLNETEKLFAERVLPTSEFFVKLRQLRQDNQTP